MVYSCGGTLERVRVVDCQLGGVSAAAVCEQLSCCRQLVRMELQQNSLGHECEVELREALRSLRLEHLDLSGNVLTSAPVQKARGSYGSVLNPCVQGASMLGVLRHMSCNKLTDQAVRELGQAQSSGARGADQGEREWLMAV